MLYVLDTSAVLNGALKNHTNIYISPIVVAELEHIKTSEHQNPQKQFLARAAVNIILTADDISWSLVSQKKINKLLKKYDFLSDINDHRLICEALVIQQELDSDITFVTYDGTQALFVKQLPQLRLEYCENNLPVYEEYCGWGKYYPTEEQFALLYNDPKINTLKCPINTYAEIFQGSELQDVLFWNGLEYRALKYKEIKDKTLGVTIRPLNLEQKMAFDLLQNKDIPVKALIGNPGTGKDILMIMHAIDLIQRGIMDKIIFIRNLVPFQDAPEIGFLSGGLDEKIAWGLGPLRSILGEEGLKMYEENGAIEAVNLGFVRGCSWDNAILYVSEGQNITGGGYKLLISRCGKGSQLWVNGDILQTDSKKFENNNGLNRLITSLNDNKLFGMVKLLKTERSEVAELASRI